MDREKMVSGPNRRKKIDEFTMESEPFGRIVKLTESI